MATLQPRTDAAELTRLADKLERNIQAINVGNGEWKQDRLTEIFALRLCAAVIKCIDEGIVEGAQAGQIPLGAETLAQMRQKAIDTLLLHGISRPRTG